MEEENTSKIGPNENTVFPISYGIEVDKVHQYFTGNPSTRDQLSQFSDSTFVALGKIELTKLFFFRILMCSRWNEKKFCFCKY